MNIEYKQIELLKKQVSNLISIIDKQDETIIKKQRRLDVLTSNVVDADYHARTVSKLNNQIEALTLDNHFLDESKNRRSEEFNRILEDRDDSTEVILQLQKENEFYKREAEKNLKRYEDFLKSNSDSKSYENNHAIQLINRMIEKSVNYEHITNLCEIREELI